MLLALPLLLFAPAANGAQPAPATAPVAVVAALGIGEPLEQLRTLSQGGAGSTTQALLLRQEILERVMLASFDVDEVLGRIDAEATHAGDSRYVLTSEKERRDARLNIATFAISGALGTAGSAMQLTRSLDHAGNALGVAAGATALTLSAVQLRSDHSRRVLLSPYNMLAEVLGQTPNAESQYPALVVAYLHSPTAGDGQLPDGQAPEASLRAVWSRLHRLQQGGSHDGASLASVTTDPTQGVKLTAGELADREAMLRDLGAAIALLKVELRSILLSLPPA